jgi:hypothetical protein
MLSGLLQATLPPRTIRVFRPVIADTQEHTPYKRLQ